MKPLLIIGSMLCANALFAQAEPSSTELLLAEVRQLRTSDPDAAGALLLTALQKSGEELEQGMVYFTLGEICLQAGLYDSARGFYEQSIERLDAPSNEETLGHAYVGLAYALMPAGNHTRALEYNLKAEKIFRKLDNRPMLGRVMKRLSDNFYEQGDYAMAGKYASEALQIAEQTADTLNMIRALNALSAIYDHREEYALTEATLERAISLGEAIRCLRCLALSYSALGISYHYQGRYEEAIGMYRKEYDVNRRIGLDLEQFFVFQNIAEALFGLKQYSAALQYSDSALQVILLENTPQYHHDVYETRYKIYKAMNRPALALEAYEKQMQFRDTLFSVEKMRIQEDLKTAYETERKEQLIADLERENTIRQLESAQARQWQWFLAVGLLLVFVLLLVLYSRYQIKQRATLALDKKNSELQSANAFKDRMFAIISHDLKSPLSSFSTISATLNEYFDQIPPEQIKSYLHRLAGSARSLEEQMNNLLAWALHQMTDGTIRLEPVSLRESVRQVSEIYQASLEARQLHLYVDVPEELVLETDREYLHTILRNLLSNAIKFTPAGGSVWVTARAEADRLKLEVRDSGIGIDRKHFEHLFTLSAEKKAIGNSPEKGTGLGLVLVKELMQKLGGEIHLESEPGKGTDFSLFFKSVHYSKAA